MKGSRRGKQLKKNKFDEKTKGKLKQRTEKTQHCGHWTDEGVADNNNKLKIIDEKNKKKIKKIKKNKKNKKK